MNVAEGEKYKPGLAKIFSEAMLHYADQNEPRSA